MKLYLKTTMGTTLDSTPYEIPAVNFPRVPAAFGRDGVGMDAAMAILDNTMEAQARVMDWRTKMQAAQQFRSGQIQGRQAVEELSQIDPRSTDYFTKRNAVIAKYPDAILDKSAQGFLGLQDDTYIATQKDANEQWEQQYYMDKEQRYERQARDSAVDSALRAINTRYKSLGTQGRDVYDTLLKQGDDPEKAIEDAEYVQKDLDDQIWVAGHDIPYDVELQLRGATPEEARVLMTIKDPDDPMRQRIEEKLGPINMVAAERFVAGRKGMKEREEEGRKATGNQFEDIGRRLKVLEEKAEMLRDSDPQDPKAEEDIRKERMILLEQQTALLGGGGVASGPRSIVTGEPLRTEAPKGSTGRKMTDRYFK